MSKWYEVKVTKTWLIAVEVSDHLPDAAAMARALDDAMEESALPMGGETEAEIESGPFEDGSAEVETMKNCADEVLHLPEVV
jgi:hypothetical protein